MNESAPSQLSFLSAIDPRVRRAEHKSDGGAVLLMAADGRLGLTEALWLAVHDRCGRGKVKQRHSKMIRQRVYGNDAAHLEDDPVHQF